MQNMRVLDCSFIHHGKQKQSSSIETYSTFTSVLSITELKTEPGKKEEAD
jgi:hypothetical protein